MGGAGSQCICNARRALYQAIALSRTASEAPIQRLFLHVPTASSSSSSSSSAARCLSIAAQLRPYSNSPRPRKHPASSGSSSSSEPQDGDDRGYDRRFTTQRDIDRSGRDRPPWDHEITDPQIMVIDNGVAEGPLSTRYVMTKLEAGESLRMISPYLPADAKATPPRAAQLAVCKIVNKRDEYERQKLVKERKKGAAAAAMGKKTKELEVTWAIGGHDLATKMRQMGGFLGKGMKVELTIGKKKGGRQVAQEEAGEVLKRVRQEVEAHGGREAKAASGQVGGTMRLYLEGVRTK